MMLRTAIFLCAAAALTAGAAQAQLRGRPVPREDRSQVELPLPANLNGLIFHDGVAFFFGDEPRRAFQTLGPGAASAPSDTGVASPTCDRSFREALTVLAANARNRGGDAVIEVSSDQEGAPKSQTHYLCRRGQVHLTGDIVATR
jgi:hypothetical protein